MDRNKKYVAIIELLAASILFYILAPFGFFLNFFLPIFRKLNYFDFMQRFFINLYFGIMFFFHSTALNLDKLGNVIIGELIEWVVTTKKNTLFGKYQNSISQAFGFLIFVKRLNKKGIYFAKIIDYVFGKDHCINAYLNTLFHMEQ